MCSKLCNLLLLFCFQLTFSQLSSADSKLLKQEFYKRINDLRVSRGKNKLSDDLSLEKAAVFHSSYMVKNSRLSHKEHILEFQNPSDRVAHFSNEFEVVGENILYTKPISINNIKRDYKKIAFDMFRSWKNSPGHYKNMISSEYELSGLGFVYSKKSRRIYATQVFGRKGVVISNQLSNNAFGLEEAENCLEDFRYNNVIVNIGNSVEIDSEGYVVFKYHNKETILKVLKSDNDGFAVDLVVKNQLACGQSNQLDKSPVYDGVLLKPIYKQEIINNNLAKGNYRLVVRLGKIPPVLMEKNISPNIIFIRNGKKCSYTVSTYIPSRKYDLRKITPKVLNPEINLKNSGVNAVEEVFYGFDSGKILANNSPTIQAKREDIVSVDINSFTSVEGGIKLNEQLHSGRAKYIEQDIKKALGNQLVVNVEAKENWELCKYQLEKRGFNELLNKSNREIRSFINKKLINSFSNELKEQRKSKAILYLKGSWENNDPNFLDNNIITGLIENNTLLINKALAELYYTNGQSIVLSNDFIFSKILNRKELVQNITALLIKNLEWYDFNDVVYYVRTWLKQPENLSQSAKDNLLNLYGITAEKLLTKWEVSKDQLANVMHPNKVEKLLTNHKKLKTTHPLLLNFHMATINYYSQINYSPKIRESFDFITQYFQSKALKIEDKVSLALFFNSWSMYSLTIQLLQKSYKNKDMNEDAVFLLAQTSFAYMEDKSKIYPLIAAAKKKNPKRWCDWVNSSNQILRDRFIKDMYCKTCN